MCPPAEIAIVNRDRRKLRARFTGMYDSRSDAYQYRMLLSDIEISSVVFYVAGKELTSYCRNNKPIELLPFI